MDYGRSLTHLRSDAGFGRFDSKMVPRINPHAFAISYTLGIAHSPSDIPDISILLVINGRAFTETTNGQSDIATTMLRLL